ncbi:hypothetical protein niasHT_012021 [Heterodera trifolii]|uniref:Uncharacterized protein n=1 Tax=Heterodera trifolii TaxID=157864 RepID=A0ABD2KUY1_9BILA
MDSAMRQIVEAYKQLFEKKKKNFKLNPFSKKLPPQVNFANKENCENVIAWSAIHVKSVGKNHLAKENLQKVKNCLIKNTPLALDFPPLIVQELPQSSHYQSINPSISFNSSTAADDDDEGEEEDEVGCCSGCFGGLCCFDCSSSSTEH